MTYKITAQFLGILFFALCGFLSAARAAPGDLDTTFASTGLVKDASTAGSNDRIIETKIQPDSKIVTIGAVDYGLRNPDRSSIYGCGLARHNADGSLDTSFDGDGKARIAISNFFDSATGVVIQTDGKIVTSGYALNILRNEQFPANTDMVIARYNPNGTLDDTFGNGGKSLIDLTYNDQANGIALDSAGRFVIAGETDGLFTVARILGGAANIDAEAPYDFDGDGKTDISIFRPSNGEWWYSRSSNGQVRAAQFDATSDKIVPADFSGDGKTDIAFYRPASGNWFILRSENASYYSVPFGTSGDIPTPGDYDGDGKFDTAVFRPASSTWYVNRSTAGLLIQQFGFSTDTPVPSAFVP